MPIVLNDIMKHVNSVGDSQHMCWCIVVRRATYFVHRKVLQCHGPGLHLVTFLSHEFTLQQCLELITLSEVLASL